MSQHNIVGSEAFDTAPLIIIRSVRTGGMRRRRSRTVVAFVAGVAATLIGGTIAAVTVFGPALAGG